MRLVSVFATAVSLALSAPPGPAARATYEAYLDSLISQTMEQHHIPAVSACAARGSDIIWHSAYGFARLEDSVPATDTTVFDLASVSKTATATALMQLCERGVFDLDDDVNDHLPFPVRHSRYPDSAITFRMLLTHTSGIADNWTVFQQLLRQGDPDVPLRAFVEGYLVPGGAYYDSSANFCSWPPGAQYRYCNLAIALAGCLVQVLGDSFHHYTRDSLFLPLEMDRTVWYFADIDTNTMASPYGYSGGNYVRYGHQSLPDVPAGTMKSSALQLGRFLVAMMNFGRYDTVRILDSATVALMTTVQHPAGVGLVWHESYIGTRQVWSHGGGWNGISTWIGFCPTDSSAAAVLTNMDGAHGAIQSVILPALFDYTGIAEETAAPVPRARLRTFSRSELERLAADGARFYDAVGRETNPAHPGIYLVRLGGRVSGKLVVTR